jgi:hypothetical protein
MSGASDLASKSNRIDGGYTSPSTSPPSPSPPPPSPWPPPHSPSPPSLPVALATAALGLAAAASAPARSPPPPLVARRAGRRHTSRPPRVCERVSVCAARPCVLGRGRVCLKILSISLRYLINCPQIITKPWKVELIRKARAFPGMPGSHPSHSFPTPLRPQGSASTRLDTTDANDCAHAVALVTPPALSQPPPLDWLGALTWFGPALSRSHRCPHQPASR